jgi:hypothetical protein
MFRAPHLPIVRVPVALAAVAAAALVTAGAAARSPQAPAAAPPPTLEEILRAAGAYVDTFPTSAAGIVLEENYVQQTRVVQLTTRRLRSDVLIMADGTEGWIEFRDVFEVDGKPVRDRDDRLARLFATPNADAREQARQIVAEGARFNLSPEGMRINRTLNVPTAALFFVRSASQPRSAFTRDGFTTIGDRRVAVVQFRETARPRLIGSADQAAARGTFWIDPATGVVLRSLLKLTTGRNAAQTAMTTQVEYAGDPRFDVWLPQSMDEHYDITVGDAPEPLVPDRSNGRLVTQALGPANITIEGQATYSNIRRFRVAVQENSTN